MQQTPGGGREPTAVQLTRMEGKVDLIMFRLDEVVAQSKQHEKDIADLQRVTQQLESDAKASAATALALAQGLRDADEARRAKASAQWTPFQRFLAVLAAGTAVTGLIIAAIR